MSKKRIYIVEVSKVCALLVRAENPAKAREHVVDVRLATQDELVTHIGAGAEVLDAEPEALTGGPPQ